MYLLAKSTFKVVYKRLPNGFWVIDLKCYRVCGFGKMNRLFKAILAIVVLLKNMVTPDASLSSHNNYQSFIQQYDGPNPRDLLNTMIPGDVPVNRVSFSVESSGTGFYLLHLYSGTD